MGFFGCVCVVFVLRFVVVVLSFKNQQETNIIVVFSQYVYTVAKAVAYIIITKYSSDRSIAFWHASI
jgi:hypothetical protein